MAVPYRDGAKARSDIAISGTASITDIWLIRELVEEVRKLVEADARTALALERLAKAYEASIKDRQIEEEIERRVKERLSK